MEILDQNQGEQNSSKKNLDQLIAEGYEFTMGDYISRGYDIFKQHMGPMVGFTFLLFVIGLASSIIPGSSLLPN